MSHESTISELKKLTKLDLLTIEATAIWAGIDNESDRATIILVASLLETSLTRQLQDQMPSLNSDERTAIFNFEGPCGSFSSRIRMAQALGLIDRSLRKRCEIIKEMRNAAAHSHAALDFSTPQIRNAVAALFNPAHREEILKWRPGKMRTVFSILCLLLARDGGEVDMEEAFTWLRNAKAQKPGSWPRKPRKPRSEGHPRGGRKG